MYCETNEKNPYTLYCGMEKVCKTKEKIQYYMVLWLEDGTERSRQRLAEEVGLSISEAI